MSIERLARTTLVVVLALYMGGCDPDPTAPDEIAVEALSAKVSDTPNSKGGKRAKEEPTTEPAPAPEYAWYRLSVADDTDPLWRFGLTGEMARLESDPTVAGWGTDYWGYWADPFPFVDGTVRYVAGLGETTYVLTTIPDGFDVSKTVVVSPYLGGEATTTVTHVGVFVPEG